jgi:hypothetical protein
MLGMAMLSTAALAQDAAPSACRTPQLIASFPNIPQVKEDLLPSVGKQLAAAGLLAKTSDCTVKLVCVGTNSSDAARQIAGAQCGVAKDAIYRGARSPSWPRGNIKVSRKAPGNGLVAGAVYVYFN